MIVRNCYDDQTEILTEKHGWCLFKDLLPDDRVASLKDGHELTFELPSYYYAERYKGEMVGMSNDAVDFLVTPDHELWTSKRATRQKIWQDFSHERAEAAYGRHLRRFKRNADWLGGYARYGIDFYEFLGFWFAEGYAGAYQYADRKEPHWRFVVVQKKYCEYARDLLTRAGLSFGETVGKDSGCTYFRIHITPALKPLIAELAALGKATKKHLPTWLKDAPEGHARAFLTGFIWGDGAFAGQKSRVTCAYTGSKRLADDLQEMALRAGWVANIAKTKQSKTDDPAFKNKGEFLYNITFLKPSRWQPTGQNGWRREEYDGMVYCVTVPSHVVYVRRNGKAFWCGQTRHDLEDTTIKTFMRWVPERHFGVFNKSTLSYRITGIPNCEIEVWFRALDNEDDIKHLLSLEVTGVWVNEAREIPWSIIKALQGRVRQYPSHAEGGCTWGGIILDTNPPDTTSEWYRFFEEKKHAASYAEIFKQPSGRSAEAENLPFINDGRAYYERLCQDADPEWIKVYVDGEYGFIKEGRAVYTTYSDPLHLKEMNPIPGIPVHRGFDYGLCYDDRTEVLTLAGWKLFKDVNVETDLIATRDPQTRVMTYVKAAFKIEEDYDGEMLEWASTELNMCVTPEHRIPYTHRDHPNETKWASAEWLAQNLGRHHHVELLSIWAPEFDQSQTYFGMGAEDFARFMGWYLSEGSSTTKWRIQVCQKKPQHIQEIRDTLAATGFKWREKVSRDYFVWRLTHHDLADYLRNLGLQPVRYVPDEIKAMPPWLLMIFLDAYTKGDGKVRTQPNGSVEHTLFSASSRMAGDMQEIAQKIGWNSSMRFVKPTQQTIYEEGRPPRVISNTGGYSVTFKKRAARAELHRRNFRRVQYQGKVYCLNVPHHTLYVRRNGRPHWNGNTPACTFSQMLPDGRWLVFDELTSDDMSVDLFYDIVADHSAKSFKKRVEFIDTGDPAGNIRSQIDKRTCFQIGLAKGFNVQPGLQGLAVRLESVRKPLRTILPGGQPQFILHPRCVMLRKGFLGGYHLRRLRVTGERYADTPEKNMFSHGQDSLQYTATRIFGTAVLHGQRAQDEERQRDFDDAYDNATRSRHTGY